MSSNNYVSSNMSTTSISRNNKNEKNQNNLKAYNNMNYINKNIIKNKILNNDFENLIMKNSYNISKTIFERNQQKNINNLNNINNHNIYSLKDSNKKTINNYKYLDISSINNKKNINISNIQKSKEDNEVEKEDEDANVINSKNNIISNTIVNKKSYLQKNISARNINRKESRNLFNNSTLDQSILNPGIIKNIGQQEMKEYKNKRDKYLNKSTKVSKKSMNNLYNYNDSSIIYNKINRRNTNIRIPKNKKDFFKKELIRNQTLYFPNYNNQSNSNINYTNKKSSSVLMSSTMYSKRRNTSKKLTSSNSMQNLIENNYFIRGNMNKSKYNLMDNFNSSRSFKNILTNDKKLPFLNLSSIKKMNKIDIYNDERNDMYFRFNKYKNNTKRESIKDRTRNALNYDFLTEIFKIHKLENNNDF